MFASDRVKGKDSLWQTFVYYFFLFVSCRAVTTPARVCSCRSTTSCGQFLPPLLAPASCTLTFSPNLLAALPHSITPRCGLSLIITYWFFIAVTTARVAHEASFEWEAEAERHGNRRTLPLIRTRSDESIGFDRRLAKRKKNCPQGADTHEQGRARAVFKTTRGQ